MGSHAWAKKLSCQKYNEMEYIMEEKVAFAAIEGEKI